MDWLNQMNGPLPVDLPYFVGYLLVHMVGLVTC